MKLYDLITPIVIGVVLVCAAVGYFSVKFLGPDNPVEEAAEEVIQLETGAKVDLTPRTPEH